MRQLAAFLQAIAVQIVVGQVQTQLAAGTAVTPAQLAKQLAHIAGGLDTPAAVVKLVEHEVAVQTFVVHKPVFQQQVAPAMAARLQLDLRAWAAAPVLGFQRQSTAQGVQSKQRVGAGHQRDRLERGAGNQVPAEHIAKRLVHAHAVQVHRQALRRTQKGRSRETPVLHIGLKGVALQLLNQHATEVGIHPFGQILAVRIVDQAALHGGRNLAGVQVHARQRRRRDDGQGVSVIGPMRRLQSKRQCETQQGQTRQVFLIGFWGCFHLECVSKASLWR